MYSVTDSFTHSLTHSSVHLIIYSRTFLNTYYVLSTILYVRNIEFNKTKFQSNGLGYPFTYISALQCFRFHSRETDSVFWESGIDYPCL